MLKGRVSTIDEEFEKGQDTPKLTKEESAEWLNMKIMNKAKDCIRYPGKDQKITLDAVTNRVYEGLVEDWGYNNIILNAMRTLKVDRAYIMAVIEILFDEDGEPIQPTKESGIGSDVKQLAEPASSEDGRASPYYTASLMTIDEAHEKLEKAYIGHKKLTAELGKKKGVKTPGALASWIGRRKYGKEKYQEMAAKDKKMKKVKPKKNIPSAKESAKEQKK